MIVGAVHGLEWNWLGGRDSNPDSQIQSLESYHWTTSQHEIEFTSATPPKSNHIHYSESTVSRGAHALAVSAAFLRA